MRGDEAAGARWKRRYGYSVSEPEPGKQQRHAGRVGVEQFDSDHPATNVVETIGRMSPVRPLDKRRRDAVQDRAPIGWDGDVPFQLASSHRLDDAQGLCGDSDRSANVVSPRDPRRKAWRVLHAAFVEPKPTRAAGMTCRRAYGDDLQVRRVSKSKQQVVRAHLRMLAARLHFGAERLTHIARANGQRWSRNNEVVDRTDAQSRA